MVGPTFIFLLLNPCPRSIFNATYFERENNNGSIEEGSLIEFTVMTCHHSQGVYYLYGAEVM